MPGWLINFYQQTFIKRTLPTAIVLMAMIGTIGYFSIFFRMDASADSLLLENDKSLDYYRQVKKKYASDDYLFVTFQPNQELFSPASIEKLTSLRNQLEALPDVESVISLIDVPVFDQQQISLTSVEEDLYQIKNFTGDFQKVKQDLLAIPLYKNLIISDDAKTTAIQVNLKVNNDYFKVVKALEELQTKQKQAKTLSQQEAQQITQKKNQLEKELTQIKKAADQRDERVIKQIRAINQTFSDYGTIYLGGIPMIAYDMIEYVKNDLLVFGVGVFLLLIIIQVFIFRRLRWIVITLGCCVITAVTSMGMLGFLNWPVTVISSNFVALLLIITMSLVVHLIVRFRQIERESPQLDYDEKIMQTISSMFTPCSYTALTTIVAFGSLMVSEIRPVIDFGKMMVMGVSLAFVLAFLIFPLFMKLKQKASKDTRNQSAFFAFTNLLAKVADKWRLQVLALAVIVTFVSAWGVSYLSVDNRFIDYFKSSTEIYRGMKVIDTQLGGTTPLEIIIERSAIEDDFALLMESNEEDNEFEDEFADEFEDEFSEEQQHNLWLSSHGIKKLHKIQNFIDSLAVTGKTLSLASGIGLVEQINSNQPLSDFELALLKKKLTPELNEVLVAPYYDQVNEEVRFLIRIKETAPELNRNKLLSQISEYFTETLEFPAESFHFTGMLILYNNMLESLFESQILTLGVVFAIILLMFVLLFRSLKLALIGIFPNIIGACFVLGLMGWFAIPLDMMTITIAAISIGIAVDNTIHYVHRFKMEYARLGDYTQAMYACHDTIARAMYYTSIIIISGFSILVLSNFMPSIYFGLFTSLAMLIALLSNLTLLPVLLLLVRPLGTGE